ncbi:MarR family transcriptional regulator [Candidatus Sodalis endolongispinus]|uniref:MarR family transcriptional regulator n=1 Tax=Candidatus Sodalis endolongispinus TaxID=2812662 RepID=A0ABS5YCK1_9GAMM|nr:MarR family transcriptional regulator [Candidatus Sodalis endolongispinus]MBT9432745.1 MarR family transcriptional regulator [Candidatus Sodalis endolongispinus]
MKHFAPEQLEAVFQLGRNIHRLNSDKDRLLETWLLPHDITAAQCKVMLLMCHEGIATSADLCRRMNLDSGATSRMLDRLENKNMLARVRCTDDRRQMRLSLTDTGRAFCRQLPSIITHTLNDLMAPLTPAEMKEFTRLLNKLVGPAGF